MSDALRNALAAAIQPAFDEWLFRMHGVVSSCGHETEAEGIAAALLPVVLADREKAVQQARAEAWDEGYGDDTTCTVPRENPYRSQAGEGVGTGAGEGATGQDTGTAWVTRSEDCPEAPAQAHPLADREAQS